MYTSRRIYFVVKLLIIIVVALFFEVQGSIASHTSQPEIVGLPGTHQDELGCGGEWLPGCESTRLEYNPEDDIWQAEFEISPNNDGDQLGPCYKVALNGSWDENYGINATENGTDIPLIVEETQIVKFYYDHKTHWITDNYNMPILVVAGDFQDQLGCNQNNDPGCLRSWLQDHDGDGTFQFVTTAIQPGEYSAILTMNEESENTIGNSQTFEVEKGDEIYFGYDAVRNELIISTEGAPKGSLAKQKAHWVNADTLLWNVVGSPNYTYALYYSLDAGLSLSSTGIANGIEIPLLYSKSGPGGKVFQKFPHLSGYTAFKIENPDITQLRNAVKGQLAVVVWDENGNIVDATGVQIPGVIDVLFSYHGGLGILFEQDIPFFRLWAPTAKTVNLLVLDDSQSDVAQVFPMDWNIENGVWTVSGKPEWMDKYYLFEVQVFVPSTGKIETNLVTDPYSFSLATNSKRSHITNIQDSSLKPKGWDNTKKPKLASLTDIVLYEMHIRDFSVSDSSVPEKLRGTYLAFTVDDSDGMNHLKELVNSGLTHLHLLPAFDIASINEDRSTWVTVDDNKMADFAPDSDQQIAAVSVISGRDGFNWGYDPLHFSVPEGSYSTNPNGSARVLEFREMVQSLNRMGLRVVMDVVYNHTNASGQHPNSVLDRIVPGYYHRLDVDGKVEKSTCCENTATEHAMMKKLMVDSVVTWAKEYRVDGFRFDLMGHHMLEDMLDVRAALDELTLQRDGVDGSSIYIYGEGWDFGEVAENARGVNASQLNISGSGIGVFNDRLRDGVRGGNPFGDPRQQGFATGLFLVPNDLDQGTSDQQLDQLFNYTDWIRLGLAGNLRDFPIMRSNGDLVPGKLVSYNGVPAAYTLNPQENVVYVAAHDNETLFDAVQLKASPDASLAVRIRMNNLAVSLVMFSQGVPFFHAGDDILRSKSLDRNSYNSGDWFNKLDWTYQFNNWGVGLPGEGRDNWDIFKPLLADNTLMPGNEEISFASEVFRELLRIRKSSPMFRFRSADQVIESVTFLNSGAEQIPGLIVMRMQDIPNVDPYYDEIVVFFNARPDTVQFSAKTLAGKEFLLHPNQQTSVDPIVRAAGYDIESGVFSIPGRTTAVFLLKTQASQQSLMDWIVTVAALIVAGLFLLGIYHHYKNR